jgi:hypothetical protein
MTAFQNWSYPDRRPIARRRRDRFNNIVPPIDART